MQGKPTLKAKHVWAVREEKQSTSRLPFRIEAECRYCRQYPLIGACVSSSTDSKVCLLCYESSSSSSSETARPKDRVETAFEHLEQQPMVGARNLPTILTLATDILTAVQKREISELRWSSRLLCHVLYFAFWLYDIPWSYAAQHLESFFDHFHEARICHPYEVWTLPSPRPRTLKVGDSWNSLLVNVNDEPTLVADLGAKKSGLSLCPSAPESTQRSSPLTALASPGGWRNATALPKHSNVTLLLVQPSTHACARLGYTHDIPIAWRLSTLRVLDSIVVRARRLLGLRYVNPVLPHVVLVTLNTSTRMLPWKACRQVVQSCSKPGVGVGTTHGDSSSQELNAEVTIEHDVSKELADLRQAIEKQTPLVPYTIAQDHHQSIQNALQSLPYGLYCFRNDGILLDALDHSSESSTQNLTISAETALLRFRTFLLVFSHRVLSGWYQTKFPKKTTEDATQWVFHVFFNKTLWKKTTVNPNDHLDELCDFAQSLR